MHLQMNMQISIHAAKRENSGILREAVMLTRQVSLRFNHQSLLAIIVLSVQFCVRYNKYFLIKRWSVLSRE